MNINLFKGDCLETMDKLIEEGIVVDAIITDPPYGTTACKWDSVIPFDKMWSRLKKLIKPNGVIVLFGSQPYTSKLICSNINMFRHNWVWNKGRGVGHLLAKKRPMMTTEDINIFYEDLTDRKYKVTSFVELRNYFRNILKYTGLSKKDILKNIGSRVDHCLRYKSSQWSLPTKKTYEDMVELYSIKNMNGYKEYNELLKEYKMEESKFKDLTYNPQMRKRTDSRLSKVKESKETCYGNLKDYEGDVLDEKYPINLIEFSKSSHANMCLHSTQKPVALMEYLIKTYTNENDLVLDFTMGSGTTGVACKNLKRKFIGIELDEKYFNIAKERIKHELQ